MSYRILEFQPNFFSARYSCSHYKVGSHCKNSNNDSGECADVSCPLKHSDWWKEKLLEWINDNYMEIIEEGTNDSYVTVMRDKLKQKIEEM